MTGYDCPVEGCDYQADQIDQLRGHVNASPDHPSWGAVQGYLDASSELVDQNDQPETASSEGGRSPDEKGDDDQPDDHETDMPTDDEPQRQREVQDGETDESGSDEKTSKKPISTNRTTPSKGGGSAGLLPALDTSTILMLLAVLAVALILCRLVSGDGGDEASEGDEEDDEEVDDLPNFDATELEDM